MGWLEAIAAGGDRQEFAHSQRSRAPGGTVALEAGEENRMPR